MTLLKQMGSLELQERKMDLIMLQELRYIDILTHCTDQYDIREYCEKVIKGIITKHKLKNKE
jgi:hypothetical protein